MRYQTDDPIREFNTMAQTGLPGRLGVEMVAIEDDVYHSKMAVAEHHMAPNGYLHAASIIALADTTCGFACRSKLPDGAQGFTTAELKSNHMGTAREGVIHCKAAPLHLGRTTQVWDAQVYNPDTDKTLAAFRCTQIILWPAGA